MSEEQDEKNLEQDIASIFGGGGMSDDDLLKMVDKHTLQLSAQQIKCLLWLNSFENEKLNKLVDKYIEIKHHNKSADMMIQALGAVSLRKFISQFRFNVNTQK